MSSKSKYGEFDPEITEDMLRFAEEEQKKDNQPKKTGQRGRKKKDKEPDLYAEDFKKLGITGYTSDGQPIYLPRVTEKTSLEVGIKAAEYQAQRKVIMNVITMVAENYFADDKVSAAVKKAFKAVKNWKPGRNASNVSSVVFPAWGMKDEENDLLESIEDQIVELHNKEMALAKMAEDIVFGEKYYFRACCVKLISYQNLQVTSQSIMEAMAIYVTEARKAICNFRYFSDGGKTSSTNILAYLALCSRSAVTEEFRRQLCNTTSYYHSTLIKITSFVESYEVEHGKKPTKDVILEALNLSSDMYDSVMATKPHKLIKPIGDDDDDDENESCGDLEAGRDSDADSLLITNSLVEKLKEALEYDDELFTILFRGGDQALCRRFNIRTYTFEELGNQYNCSKATISKKYKTACNIIFKSDLANDIHELLLQTA